MFSGWYFRVWPPIRQSDILDKRHLDYLIFQLFGMVLYRAFANYKLAAWYSPKSRESELYIPVKFSQASQRFTFRGVFLLYGISIPLKIRSDKLMLDWGVTIQLIFKRTQWHPFTSVIWFTRLVRRCDYLKHECWLSYANRRMKSGFLQKWIHNVDVH